MGRPVFERFLTELAGGRSPSDQGVCWAGEFASWQSLLERGRQRSHVVQPQAAYVVDPTVGLEAMASFFAVATVPDTILLWARPSAVGTELDELGPGLHRLPERHREPLGRPMWGVASSGSTGKPKLAVGWGDGLELVASHYDHAVYQHRFPDRGVDVLATCLPLEFSAPFFMTVLPSLFLCRDLLVFPAHDWGQVEERAGDANVAVLSVPAVAAAASIGATRPLDFSRVMMLLGAGYITAERVRTIHRCFRGARLMNIYGTAETGAISIDPDPGHCTHVGRPIPGKPVWVLDPDDKGVGAVATAGPDCRSFFWSPDEGLQNVGDVVASTDYGHFDDDGHLYLDGRVDGGEKLFGVMIYPREIERHILALDGVADVRVKVSGKQSGTEQLIARVVGDVEEQAVREHCAALPEVLRPGQIECLTDEAAVVGAYSAHGKL